MFFGRCIGEQNYIYFMSYVFYVLDVIDEFGVGARRANIEPPQEDDVLKSVARSNAAVGKRLQEIKDLKLTMGWEDRYLERTGKKQTVPEERKKGSNASGSSSKAK